MSKYFLSLFARLYLSIALTVFLSILLGLFVTEAYSENEEVDSFAADADFIFQQLVTNQELFGVGQQQHIDLPFPLYRYFSAKFINRVNNKACQSCDFIKAIDGVNYYELAGGERLAEFVMAGSQWRVAIYEKIDSERSEEELALQLVEGDTEQALFFTLLALVLALLAITIYWPINKLKKQIRQLINTHQQFGAGVLSVKADENIQKPLDELAVSFNAMTQAIIDNIKERDTFAHAIPHEVRTPLSRIQLASGLIRKKSCDKEVQALVDDVDNYVIDINELISQIVEFSKIKASEKGVIQQQIINVKAFVESRLNLLMVNQNKAVEVVIDEAIKVNTNPFYLRLLVDNLILNALNHAKSKIELSVTIQHDKFQFTVEDDGKGVPLKMRETIFVPFARVDKSRSRKTGGLGLGLPIAKAAAKKMVGSIRVADASLGGAMFIFTSDVILKYSE